MAWVAGCDHIRVSIAGAMTNGARTDNKVNNSASSARPVAIRANKLALAGTITTRSVS